MVKGKDTTYLDFTRKTAKYPTRREKEDQMIGWMNEAGEVGGAEGAGVGPPRRAAGRPRPAHAPRRRRRPPGAGRRQGDPVPRAAGRARAGRPRRAPLPRGHRAPARGPRQGRGGQEAPRRGGQAARAAADAERPDGEATIAGGGQQDSAITWSLTNNTHNL